MDREALLFEMIYGADFIHFLEARSVKDWFWDCHEFEYKAAGIEISQIRADHQLPALKTFRISGRSEQSEFHNSGVM